MSAAMRLTTDEKSNESYGIQNIYNVIKYGNSFSADDELYIVIGDDDKQFLITPTAGGYLVSYQPNDTYPAVATGSPMTEVNSEPNSGLRGFDGWPGYNGPGTEKRLYIKSLVDQVIGVSIFKSRSE